MRVKWLENALVSVPEEAKREAELALAKVDLRALLTANSPLILKRALYKTQVRVEGLPCRLL